MMGILVQIPLVGPDGVKDELDQDPDDEPMVPVQDGPQKLLCHVAVQKKFNMVLFKGLWKKHALLISH